jgi:hypothetical protein
VTPPSVGSLFDIAGEPEGANRSNWFVLLYSMPNSDLTNRVPRIALLLAFQINLLVLVPGNGRADLRRLLAKLRLLIREKSFLCAG